MLLGGCAVVLLSLFLPWWGDGGITANGFHDWGWLSFFSLFLVGTLYTARHVADVRTRIPPMSVSDPAIYMVGGIAEMVGALVFWLSSTARISGSVRYGVLVCVVGGALTAAGGYARLTE